MHPNAQQIIADLENDLVLTDAEKVPSGQLASFTKEVARSVHDNSRGFQQMMSRISIANRVGDAIAGLGGTAFMGTFIAAGAIGGANAIATSFGADLSHLYDPYVLTSSPP